MPLDNSLQATTTNVHESGTVTLWRQITGTSQAELFIDGAATRFSVPNNRAYTCTVLLTAIVRTAGSTGTPPSLGNASSYGYTCAFSNIAGTYVLLGGTAKAALFTATGDTTGASILTGASVAIAADDTNKALTIKYTPPTAAVATTVIDVTATIIYVGAGWN